MQRLILFGLAALALSASVFAAPNVTNATQKGSLLIFPDIRIDGWNTLIRLENDGSQDVDVICYWMDGNKNKVDFIVTITRNAAIWFDARTGNGSSQVNPFPQSPANGFDNPFLIGPPTIPGTTEATDSAGPYPKGMLACWAVDTGAQNQVKWNHLSGTATVYGLAAYEYNAYAFFAPTGLDLQPVGTAGTLNLNGVEYDSCPQYMIGQFSPTPSVVPTAGAGAIPLVVGVNRLALAGCTLNLNQDWTPVFTKYQFDIWNEDEVKFTGAFECADSWHETAFEDPADPAAAVHGGGIDSAAQNFTLATLGTVSARYRVQGIKSSQCERPPTIVTQAVGVLAVQSSLVGYVGSPALHVVGSTLAAAGKFNGRIVWDPEGAVPEGSVR